MITRSGLANYRRLRQADHVEFTGCKTGSGGPGPTPISCSRYPAVAIPAWPRSTHGGHHGGRAKPETPSGQPAIHHRIERHPYPNDREPVVMAGCARPAKWRR
ncbi:MAG: hypothetical protein J2P48_04005 [Alphaproteobacteria bacterium]|nr:hypothetical protein [Alphaproteobacteria bacterium]